MMLSSLIKAYDSAVYCETAYFNAHNDGKQKP
jgi:hypothetical protein